MNVLPEAIIQILEECRCRLEERGELLASNREEIYKQIDNFSTKENPNAGHARRARLELTCAWKVLGNWSNCELTDDSANELLDMAEKFLQGEGDLKELERRKNNFYTQVEDLMDNGKEYFVAAYAGFASISAADAVLYNTKFEPVALPEIEIYPDDWTACFYACISYCGGATWEEGVGDDLKRREFWEWFLNDAVPPLWQM